VAVAYNQWTQFEDFPKFMEGVESVEQIDDERMHWVANIAGKRLEWDAHIREQVPDRRIAWLSDDGKEIGGEVDFEPITDGTRIHVRMGYQSEGLLENAGAVFGFDSRRVQKDLRRFKEFIESRGIETGGWRGEIGTEGRDQGMGRGPMGAEPDALGQRPPAPRDATPPGEF